jgi:cysteine desulfurase
VRANAQALAEQTPGIRLSDVAVTKNGMVDLPAFRLQLMQGKGRTLVAIMAANNETGVVQPLEAIAQIIRTEAEDALLHVDATQSAGRVALSFAALDADTMALSSHKMGGPLGAGALLIRDGAPFAPLIAGAQESGRRGGTENVAAIAGFGVAVEDANDDVERARLWALRDRFETGLKKLAADAVIFGEDSERLPNTSNFAIPGLSAETALIALDMDGIALSSGAACSSGKVHASHVLAAMGVAEDLARCGLRVSLGWSNDEHDIDAALVALDRLLRRKERLKAAAA